MDWEPVIKALGSLFGAGVVALLGMAFKWIRLKYKFEISTDLEMKINVYAQKVVRWAEQVIVRQYKKKEAKLTEAQITQVRLQASNKLKTLMGKHHKMAGKMLGLDDGGLRDLYDVKIQAAHHLEKERTK